MIASSYPFLDVVWTMFIFFAFVIFTPLLGVLVYMIVRPPLDETLMRRSRGAN